MEALHVISGLPLMVQVELGLDPGCFFRRADYAGILDGEWDSVRRVYKNKLVINQEQYLQELDDCFLANSEYLPEVVIMDQGGKRASSATTMAKDIAMANGEDEASVLSQLTDKTLKEAHLHTDRGNLSSNSSVTSVQSGNTSRSKTQAAVKEALKEVSLEHNKAMIEQKKQFQKEIEALRKALEQRAAMTTETTEDIELVEGAEVEHNNSVEDSSNDEASMQQITKPGRHALEKPTKSPIHKRPKCSKYRSPRGCGGPSSSTSELNE
jgi:hypothetical protein